MDDAPFQMSGNAAIKVGGYRMELIGKFQNRVGICYG
jgi:hypothetical protein